MNDSAIESVEQPAQVEPEADLEDILIRIAPRVEKQAPSICPNCARPTKSHSATQAYMCMRAVEGRQGTAGDDEEAGEPTAAPKQSKRSQGRWYIVHTLAGHEQKVKHDLEARVDAMKLGDRIFEIVERSVFPGYLLVRCELDETIWPLIRNTPGVNVVGGARAKPAPLSKADVDKFLSLREKVDEEEPEALADLAFETFTGKRGRRAPDPKPAEEPVAEDDSIDAAIPADPAYPSLSSVPMPVNEQGEVEIDFEALAGALRTVIERERDEVLRRGGPLEKQNAQLKERLATALDQAAMWRQRAQTNAMQRNTLDEQLQAAHKENRKLRNELKGRKENNQTRVLEINELLRIAQNEPGWTVERAGNGHFLFKKDGIFVTDAASSGQGNRVNMATRNALKKHGLPV